MTYIPGQKQNYVPESIAANTQPHGSFRAAKSGQQTGPGGAAGGVLDGYYPNPGFKQDMATQEELDAAIAGISFDLTGIPQGIPGEDGDPGETIVGPPGKDGRDGVPVMLLMPGEDGQDAPIIQPQSGRDGSPGPMMLASDGEDGQDGIPLGAMTSATNDFAMGASMLNW